MDQTGGAPQWQPPPNGSPPFDPAEPQIVVGNATGQYADPISWEWTTKFTQLPPGTPSYYSPVSNTSALSNGGFDDEFYLTQNYQGMDPSKSLLFDGNVDFIESAFPEFGNFDLSQFGNPNLQSTDSGTSPEVTVTDPAGGYDHLLTTTESSWMAGEQMTGQSTQQSNDLYAYRGATSYGSEGAPSPAMSNTSLGPGGHLAAQTGSYQSSPLAKDHSTLPTDRYPYHQFQNLTVGESPLPDTQSQQGPSSSPPLQQQYSGFDPSSQHTFTPDPHLQYYSKQSMTPKISFATELPDTAAGPTQSHQISPPPHDQHPFGSQTPSSTPPNMMLQNNFSPPVGGSSVSPPLDRDKLPSPLAMPPPPAPGSAPTGSSVKSTDVVDQYQNTSHLQMPMPMPRVTNAEQPSTGFLAGHRARSRSHSSLVDFQHAEGSTTSGSFGMFPNTGSGVAGMMLDGPSVRNAAYREMLPENRPLTINPNALMAGNSQQHYVGGNQALYPTSNGSASIPQHPGLHTAQSAPPNSLPFQTNIQPFNNIYTQHPNPQVQESSLLTPDWNVGGTGNLRRARSAGSRMAHTRGARSEDLSSMINRRDAISGPSDHVPYAMGPDGGLAPPGADFNFMLPNTGPGSAFASGLPNMFGNPMPPNAFATFDDSVAPATGEFDGGVRRHRRTSSAASERASPYARPPDLSPSRDEMNEDVFDEDDSAIPSTSVQRAQVTTAATKTASQSRRKGEANFKCPVEDCNATFTRAYNLNGHMRAHNNERPFKCSWQGCNRTFSRTHDCKRHEQLHLDKRDHKCDGCGKEFARLDALNRHLKSEGGADCRIHYPQLSPGPGMQAGLEGFSNDVLQPMDDSAPIAASTLFRFDPTTAYVA